MSLIERQRPRFTTQRFLALVFGVLLGVLVFEVSHREERDSRKDCEDLTKLLVQAFPAFDALLTEGPEKDSGKHNLQEIERYANRAREHGRATPSLEHLRLGIGDVLAATLIEEGLQSERAAQKIARGLVSVQRSVDAFDRTCRE